ncbi:MAG TPA: biopolymer transporter ExbD [Gammaproteobacteria bacterium]
MELPMGKSLSIRTRFPAHAAADAHGIDLAPMLDFVVNLLIFFIITAVFVRQAGIEVSRPSVVTPAKETTSKSFVINEQGEISVDLKPIDLRTVRAHVERFKAADAHGGIVIMADRHAPTGAVLAVADQVRLAGVSDITFITATLAALKP